ncbi:hypothetical protein RDWZM_008912 [Blomia tropicalis]|uniref:Single-stranded DNA-binding protein, mitochondrial n=1 Tax=Blomia tropicalis TaxID=40697 RepID=A0A9Q0M242_BLOTA|nr:hypothetical protein RDWZM_008912 [Blomia tropicalis]
MLSLFSKSGSIVNGLRSLSTIAASELGPRVPDNSKCINKVILMGRCVGESLLKPINNTHYSSFIMATNEMRKTRSNELVKRSDFHKVFVYQPFLAKKCHDLIMKGTRVYLEGKLNYRKVENQFFSNIVAEKIIFISGTNQNYEADADDIADVEDIDHTFLEEGEEKSQTQSNY